MFDNMSKDDRQRYLVIGMIILFVFSTVAIYLFNPIGGGGGAGPIPPGSSNASAFSGHGIANATLLSWEPVLVVSGNSSSANALLLQWQSDGLLTASPVMQSGSRILRLSDSKYVTSITSALLALNLSVRGQGAISIAQAFVSGSGINRTVSGGVYTYEDTPIFEEGDVFPVSFDAYVVGTTIQSAPINLQPLSPGSLNVEFAPLSVKLNTTFFQTYVPWENRTLKAGQYFVNLVGGDDMKYKPRSYVQTNAPITSTQRSALLAKPPAWLDNGNVQAYLIGVQTNYTDSTQIRNDLAPLGITPIFPDSVMAIFPYRGNSTDAEIKARLISTWDETFPGLGQNFTIGYVLDITLPPTLIIDGQTYQIANQTSQIASDYPPMASATLKAVFQPIGHTINGFSSPPVYSPPAGSASPAVNNSGTQTTSTQNPGSQTAQNSSGQMPALNSTGRAVPNSSSQNNSSGQN